VVFCGPERGVAAGAFCGEVAELCNAAGFKKKKQKKSVSSVMLASEVQILPSPHQLFQYRSVRCRLGEIQGSLGKVGH
jgi:hypothetical protein